MRTLSVPLMTPDHHVPCLGASLPAPQGGTHPPMPCSIAFPDLFSPSAHQPDSPFRFPQPATGPCTVLLSFSVYVPGSTTSCGPPLRGVIYCTEPMSDDFCTGPLQGSSGPGELAPPLHPTPPPAGVLLPGLAEGQLQPLTSLLMPPRGDTSLPQLKCCYSCLQEQSHKHANGFPLPCLGWQGHPTSPYVLLWCWERGMFAKAPHHPSALRSH